MSLNNQKHIKIEIFEKVLDSVHDKIRDGSNAQISNSVWKIVAWTNPFWLIFNNLPNDIESQAYENIG